ncbi:T9SS type A sorting domain-containing protein [Hymenobacter guriensis]|uniref:T9SS type A sorting domain-containing protein n=1 Tax=Hymenobacter guriensis TaxID=2793065 RepID=A0ABS0L068_9BACT|nr:T9SS type A sorting domain-containing protein [Hymenobacter guriensis]MBG8552782.1 T9SS type A sorting domain-containing protein [Hymenobacter guriensis]
MKLSTLVVLLALLVGQQLSGVAAAVTARKDSLPAVAARQQPELAASMQLYPNPARGMVMLTLQQQPGQDYKLRISNIIGREVRVLPLRAELTAAGQPLNLSDLPAGMYMCSLLQNEKVMGTKRLVLQN